MPCNNNEKTKQNTFMVVHMKRMFIGKQKEHCTKIQAWKNLKEQLIYIHVHKYNEIFSVDFFTASGNKINDTGISINVM